MPACGMWAQVRGAQAAGHGVVVECGKTWALLRGMVCRLCQGQHEGQAGARYCLVMQIGWCSCAAGQLGDAIYLSTHPFRPPLSYFSSAIARPFAAVLGAGQLEASWVHPFILLTHHMAKVLLISILQASWRTPWSHFSSSLPNLPPCQTHDLLY
jgi:hypothetical protein